MVSQMINQNPIAREQGRLSRVFKARALVLALCTSALTHAPALGQGFIGDHDVILGNAEINEMGNITNIYVSSDEAVINWSVSDTGDSFDFLPSGNSVYFNGPSNYVVLNRIIPQTGTPIIGMNGLIEASQISGQGGQVWFYSPGGFLIGATAQINVGSLVLSSSEIDYSPGQMSSGTISFTGLADPTSIASRSSRIVIEDGARIEAASDFSANSSYLAIVAPRIEQGGLITVDGSVALVAAEAATLRFNAGLVDVSVLLGSEDANGIVHSGQTTGPASTGLADIKRIAMVAVPKNDAMTMLLSGDIGYTPAASANEDGSAIILSGGYDLTGDTTTLSVGGAAANIEISDAVFSSSVGSGDTTPSRASGTITIGDTGSVTFQSTTTLNADTALEVIANAGQTISFEGTANLSAANGSTGGQLSLFAGPEELTVPAGLIVAQTLSLNANATQAPGGADATGGTISLLAQGGEINVSSLDIGAYAYGADGGNAQGGSISLTVRNDGVIESGYTVLGANGMGGSSDMLGGTGTGGTGTGGTVTINEDGGSLLLSDIIAEATGWGGGGDVQSGDCRSGLIALSFSTTQTIVDFLDLKAEANAGGLTAIDARSGSAIGNADAVKITVGGTGELLVTGASSISANAYTQAFGLAGTQAQGGGVSVVISDTGSAHFEGMTRISADAFTAAEVPGNENEFNSAARGGSVTIRTNGGLLSARTLDLSANATGAAAAAGGTAASATGGTVLLDVANGEVIITGDDINPDLLLSASGFGSVGPTSARGQGGTAQISIGDGLLQVEGGVGVMANGSFDTTDASSDLAETVTNTGGTARVDMLAGGGSLIADSLTITADGDGGLTDAWGDVVTWRGDASHGQGGSAFLNMAGGEIDTSRIAISSNGYGGSMSAGGYLGGDGQGGISRLTATGGTITSNELSIESFGYGGGDGGMSMASIGGVGRGGTAILDLDATTFSAGDQLLISADGFGGSGGFGGDGPGGSGGDGFGGTAQTIVGGLADISGGYLLTSAAGNGGNGGESAVNAIGAGGYATGGTASVDVSDGLFRLSNMEIVAAGFGGYGSLGGNGIGGSTTFNLIDIAVRANPTLAEGLTREIGNLSLTAAGFGGFGENTDGSETAGIGSMSIASGSASTALSLTDGLSVMLGSGALSATGQGFLLTTANTAFTLEQGLEITTPGPISINAGTGAPIVIGGDLLLSTLSTITGTGVIDVGGAAQLSAANGISLDVLRTGADASFTAPNGAIAVTGDLAVGGTLSAAGQSIAFTAVNGLDLASVLASNGGITITTGQGVNFSEQVSASGAIIVNAGGAVVVETPLTATAITLNGSDVSTTDAAPLVSTSGDIIITATNGATIGNIINAAGALRVTAGGAAQFAGLANASEIAVQAADIQLGANAALGSLARTRSVALTFSGPNAVTIGGPASANAGLSADEISRIFAQDAINILAGSAAPDVMIQSFSLNSGSGGTLGSTGRFGITGFGRMVVSGLIDFTTGSSTATLDLGASDIAILSDTGGIILHGATQAPQGQALFTADRLFVGRSEALTAIDGLTGLGEIAAILHRPPAGGTPGDALVAGHIGATIGDALFIQNLGASDAFADRQGFLADSISITNRTAGPIAMSINGRLSRAAGTFLTGMDVVSAISHNGAPLGLAAGAYRALSTVNGCVLGQTCGGSVSLVPPRETLSVETVIGATPTLESQQPPITFGDMPLFETAPLVDEPVTGVGNEDLWDAEKP